MERMRRVDEVLEGRRRSSSFCPGYWLQEQLLEPEVKLRANAVGGVRGIFPKDPPLYPEATKKKTKKPKKNKNREASEAEGSSEGGVGMINCY